MRKDFLIATLNNTLIFNQLSRKLASTLEK